MRAASEGQIKIAELLINNGAEVNATNDFGRTALDLAIKEGHSEIAELLRSRGAE